MQMVLWSWTTILVSSLLAGMHYRVRCTRESKQERRNEGQNRRKCGVARRCSEVSSEGERGTKEFLASATEPGNTSASSKLGWHDGLRQGAGQGWWGSAYSVMFKRSFSCTSISSRQHSPLACMKRLPQLCLSVLVYHQMQSFLHSHH
jgi:hypothetical protein